MMINGTTASVGGRPAMPPKPSAEEMARMKEEMFNRVDSDGSGGVDTVELSALAEKMREHSNQGLSAEEMLEKMDSDGDGELSRTELEKGMEEMRPRRDGGRPPMPPSGGADHDGERTGSLYGPPLNLFDSQA